MAITISGPSHDTDGTYTLSWGGNSNSTYSKLYFRSGTSGNWNHIYNSSPSGGSKTETRGNGVYQYYIKNCTVVGSPTGPQTTCNNGSTKTVTVVKAPNKPGIDDISANACDTSWTVDWSSGGGYPSGVDRLYHLQQSVDGGSWTTVSSTLTSTQKNRSITESTSYRYRVRSRYRYSGYYSAWSGYDDTDTFPVPACTPGQPGQPSLSTNGTTITVSWSASSDGVVENYRLQRRRRHESSGSWSGWSTISGDAASPYSDSGRSRGYYYQYQVRGENNESAGDQNGDWSAVGPPAYIPYAPPDTPAKPGLSQPDADASTGVDLQWNRPSGKVDGYHLQRRNDTDGIGFTTIATIYDPDTTTYTDGDTEANHKYRYRVRAYNGDNTGDYSSASDQLRVKYLRPDPASLDAGVGLGDDGIYQGGYSGVYTVDWSATGGTVSYFDVDERAPGGSWQAIDYNDAGDDTKDCGANQCSYDKADNHSGSADLYDYRAQACNSDYCSGWMEITVRVRTYPTPGAPTAFAVDSVASATGDYEITWSAPANTPPNAGEENGEAVTHYKLDRTQSAGVDYPQITHDDNQADYGKSIDDGVSGEHYTYRVAACFDPAEEGADPVCSDYTQSKTAYVPYPVPGTPAEITGPDSLPDGTFPVGWSAAQGGAFDHYELEETINGDTTVIDVGTTTTYTAGGTPGTYQYRVRACSPDAHGELTPAEACSAWSQQITLNALTTPAEFEYSLNNTSGIPMLGDGQFVASSEGSLGVNQGAARYSLPIELPPAVRELKPDLSLSYNSRNGNGMLGVGWSLSGLSVIKRCAPTFASEGAEAQGGNPRYTDADRLCLDGQKLEIASLSNPAGDATYWAAGAEYRTEIDRFAKVEAFDTHNGAHAYFEVRTKDGLIMTYGRQEHYQNSRIYAPGQSNGPVGIWALDKVEDRYGNSYQVHYERNTTDGHYRPKHITWAPGAAVVFSYADRSTLIPGPHSDMPWGYDNGGIYQRPKLLTQVTTYINAGTTNPDAGQAVRQYDIEYERSPTTDRYRVSTITECGHDEDGHNKQCAEPLEFGWQDGELGFESEPADLLMTNGEIMWGGDQAVDIDYDGYVDLLSGSAVRWGNPDGQFDPGASIASEIGQSADLITTLSGDQLVGGSTDPDAFGVAALQPGYSSSVGYQQLLSSGISRQMTADINNDGLDDILTASTLWIQQPTDPVSFTPHSLPDSVKMKEATFTDFNSDGLVDYLAEEKAYRNTGNGFVEENDDLPLSDSGEVTIHIPMYGNNTNMQMSGTMARNHIDVNGDGKRDLMYHYEAEGETTGRWYVRMNTGDGFGPEIPTGISAGHQRNQYSFVYDWDKDGRQDLIAETPDNDAWRVLLSRFADGKPAFKELPVDPFDGKFYKDGYDVSGAVAGMYMATGAAQIFRGDFNNDGLVDLFFWWGNQVDPPKIWYAKQQQPDLMATVTNGLGAQTQLEYSPLTGDDNNGEPLYTPSSEKPAFPERPAPRSAQVVKRVSTDDGQGGWRHRYYNYTGAKQHARGRGFLGFEQIKVTDTGRGKVTTTTYRQDFPFVKNVLSREVRDTAGNLISRVDNTYAVHDINSRLAYLDTQIQRKYKLTATSLNNPLSVTKVDNTYDRYGNLTGRTTTIGTGLSGSTVSGVKHIETVTNDSITNNTTEWLLGFVESRTVETSRAGGADLRRITTEFDPEQDTLDVMERRDFVGAPVWKTTITERNTDGVVTGTSVEAADIDNGTAPTRETSLSNFSDIMYPGATTNAESHQATLGYDRRFGKIDSETGPNNLTTTRTYDVLGRVVKETAPDGTVTRIKRFYCDNTPVTCPSEAEYLVATEITHPDVPGKLGAPLEITFYDKLRREVQSRTYSLDYTVVKVDTEYYADGHTRRVSEPYAGTTPQYWTTYNNYDALGRAHDITAPDGGSVHYNYTREYGLHKTEQILTVITPDGTDTWTQARYTNALGQVEQVVDANLTPVDYTYDTHGNLETTTVNNNPATTVTIDHDKAGNKAWIDDPDAGVIEFDYNGFGELRRQTWAANTAEVKSMVYTYDKLGRQTGRTAKPANGAPQVAYTWVWDTEKKGLLSSRSGNGMSESYVYDGLGRLKSQNTTLDGLGMRTFSYDYDDFSRPETIVYPDGLTVEHRYHAAGVHAQTLNVTDADNPAALWTLGNASDSRGSFTLERFGNGVITRHAFDPASGRIERIETGWPGANGMADMTGNIQDLSFEFDTLGNLYERNTGRSDLEGNAEEFISEVFTYDDLNRLKTGTTTWIEADTPQRQRSYDYDALGNLIERSDVGPLAYDQSNGAGVHAVTAAGGQSYHYDAYGNLVQRGGETLEYNVFNKPTRIGSTTFRYGPDHARYKQVDGERTVYYINGGRYKEIVQDGQVTTRSTVDGYYVRSVTGGEVEESYLHSDHLGSVGALSDSWATLAGRMSFGPWGQRQQADWENGDPTGGQAGFYPTDRGFTGHEMLDSSGLVHMNGRVYDPAIGRFLSPDLVVQAPYNSQSFNRYSYVLNNPLSLVDPSGYSSEESDGDNGNSGESANANDNPFAPECRNCPVIEVEGVRPELTTQEKMNRAYRLRLESGYFQAQSNNLAWGMGITGSVNVGPLVHDACGGDMDCIIETYKDLAVAQGVALTLVIPTPDDALLIVAVSKSGKVLGRALALGKGTGKVIDSKRLNHIFRNKRGHIKDTPENRKLLENVANKKSNRLGTDKYGNEWHAQTRSDGTQVWTQSRKGKIVNGGVNETPRNFDPATGLSSPTKPGG